MKTKNLFVAIVVFMTILLGFTTCINGNGGGNSFNYSYVSPAIIGYDAQVGMTLNTYYATLIPDNTSAQSLSSLSPGSCIYMSFDYNSEYQTSQYYSVASNISFQPVDVGVVNSIQEGDTAMVSDYNCPLSSVQLLTDNAGTITSTCPNYGGRFFIGTFAKLGQNQTLQYYPYIKPDEQLDLNGARNIYLQAELPGTGELTGTQDVGTVYALDMRNILLSSGSDTTIVDGSGTNYSVKYMKINLQYCSSIENGSPVFTSVATQPIYIYAFNDDL